MRVQEVHPSLSTLKEVIIRGGYILIVAKSEIRNGAPVKPNREIS